MITKNTGDYYPKLTGIRNVQEKLFVLYFYSFDRMNKHNAHLFLYNCQTQAET